MLCCSDTAADRAAAALDVHVGAEKGMITCNHWWITSWDYGKKTHEIIRLQFIIKREALFCFFGQDSFMTTERKTRFWMVDFVWVKMVFRERFSAGYFSDPEDVPGLAHFCEHMLFLGTEPFPEENSNSAWMTSAWSVNVMFWHEYFSEDISFLL